MDEACKCKTLWELFGEIDPRSAKERQRAEGAPKKSIEEIDFFFYAPIGNRAVKAALGSQMEFSVLRKSQPICTAGAAVWPKGTARARADISGNNEH